MTQDLQGRQRKRKRLWLALALLVAILAVVIVPPLVSVSHFKNQITHLMAASLDRPVRLSSVELQLLPRPGFVLNDLTVEEDPAYGTEPMLHAATVTASIRLLSLWRGRLEISRISVDEASLNLVRNSAGRWNLDSLFRTAAKAGPVAGPRQAVPLPYLRATNSRINIKNGAEKLPFSLVETEVSLQQEQPGNWRIRLQGQPVRTDLSLESGDTGIVELDATVQSAPNLRNMPVRLDLEWREAQLGQLARLVIGKDPGWRGDLRGQLHMEGTAEAAQIKTRLRATGVHREEFTPASPLDFDANCGFLYHHAARTVENLVCDSPLGSGRIRVAGDLPGAGSPSHFSVELDHLPAAAGLDALRTVRSGVGPGLVVAGTVSGKIVYDETAAQANPQKSPVKTARVHPAKPSPVAPGPLTGSFTVEGLQVSGGGLSQPILAPKMVLEPALAQGHSQALAGTVAIPAGGAVPLTVNLRLASYGYQVTVRGQAAIARSRELAHAAGITNIAALNELAGDPLAVDLSAEGPWMPADEISPADIAAAVAVSVLAKAQPGVNPSGIPVADSLGGTVTLHNANWKANYLANHVEIALATLHVDNGATRWDPVVFSYGPVKGTATLTVPAACPAPAPCAPAVFNLEFGDLDAATLQAAVLGAHEKGTMLSALISRIHPSAAPAWPTLEGTVKADSLALGPVTLRKASAVLHLLPDGVEITGLDGELLGGHLHAAGEFHTGDKPAYTLAGHFEKLNPVAVGQRVGERWSGGTLDADAKIDLSGYSDSDLAGSAKGTLHFDWQHGTVAGAGGTIPPVLTRFTRWIADAAIADHKITLGTNEVLQGSRKAAVEATATLTEPAKATFVLPKAPSAKKR